MSLAPCRVHHQVQSSQRSCLCAPSESSSTELLFPQTHQALTTPCLCICSSLSLECLSPRHHILQVLVHALGSLLALSLWTEPRPLPCFHTVLYRHLGVSIYGPALSLPFVCLSLPWDCEFLGQLSLSHLCLPVPSPIPGL